jgi:hypothetical protein
MEQLINAIRAATASGATTDQKAAAVQACRAIITALDTEPGQPIVLPGTPPQSPLAGISIDHVIDLLVARLTVVATAREAATALPPSPAPTGFRVPAVAPPRALARPANATRPAVTKRANTPTRKP